MNAVTGWLVFGGVCVLLLVVAGLVAVFAVVQARARRETSTDATTLGWRFGASPDVRAWSQPLVDHVYRVHHGQIQNAINPASAITTVETVRGNWRITAGRFVCLTTNLMVASPLPHHYQLVVVHLRQPHPPAGDAHWRVNGHLLYRIDDLGLDRLQQLDIHNVTQQADYLLQIAEKLEPSRSSYGA